jgi:hypothetical protein
MVDFQKHPMTQQQAEYIRSLRVDLGYSWRKLAGTVSIVYPELNIKCHKPFNGQVSVSMGTLYLDGYQSEGMDLCTEAAEFFGENAGDEPWN